jgi:hypothetical protein
MEATSGGTNKFDFEHKRGSRLLGLPQFEVERHGCTVRSVSAEQLWIVSASAQTASCGKVIFKAKEAAGLCAGYLD